jgi:chemotaxis protein MotB
MARSARFTAIAVLGSLFILSTGCVSQEKYSALKLERDALYEQLAKAQTDASSAQAAANSYKSQIDAIMGGSNNLQGLIANLQQQNAQLQSQLDDLNHRYADALGKVGTGAALPEALDSALKQFAAQNPDLIEFDSNRGVVKFKSDVTFAKGDAALTSQAREAISRFAQILNSDAAAHYDLMVAGHTDNTPVSNPETIKKGHLDNWYLSAHRAISVEKELQNNRVSPQRVAIAGYAEFRPIAANSSSSGQEKNRRVEVLILPTQAPSSVASTPAPTHNAHPAPHPMMNKDSAAAPTGSTFNK